MPVKRNRKASRDRKHRLRRREACDRALAKLGLHHLGLPELSDFFFRKPELGQHFIRAVTERRIAENRIYGLDPMTDV
jgi:hypothetical protein